MARRLATLLMVITAAALTFAAAAGADHRTNNYQWYTTNPPATWDDGLVNGVLVWDNVSGQCHDFQRTGGSGMPVWRGAIDGRGRYSLYAITTNYSNVKYDIDEIWHLNVQVPIPPDGGSVDLWSLAAHEMGHTLHLVHSGTPADTMYSTYDWGVDYWRSLTANDMNRERSLYGC